MEKEIWRIPSKDTKMDFHEVCEKIREFINEDNNYDYHIAVGTDSQQHGKDRKIVSSISVRRMEWDGIHGRGGQYFYTVEWITYIKTLRQQIMYEASLTYKFKELLKEELKDILEEKNIFVQPHSDIGRKGQTKELIPEVKGMFSGFGPQEDVVIKPYSYCASWLANKHTK